MNRDMIDDNNRGLLKIISVKKVKQSRLGSAYLVDYDCEAIMAHSSKFLKAKKALLELSMYGNNNNSNKLVVVSSVLELFGTFSANDTKKGKVRFLLEKDNSRWKASWIGIPQN